MCGMQHQNFITPLSLQWFQEFEIGQFMHVLVILCSGHYEEKIYMFVLFALECTQMYLYDWTKLQRDGAGKQDCNKKHNLLKT